MFLFFVSVYTVEPRFLDEDVQDFLSVYVSLMMDLNVFLKYFVGVKRPFGSKPQGHF